MVLLTTLSRSEISHERLYPEYNLWTYRHKEIDQEFMYSMGSQIDLFIYDISNDTLSIPTIPG